MKYIKDEHKGKLFYKPRILKPQKTEIQIKILELTKVL